MWRSIASKSSFPKNFGRKLVSSQTPLSQVIPKTLNSSSSSSCYSSFSFKGQNPRNFPPQNHRFFSHSSSITEIEAENHDSSSSEELEPENGDTHDASLSKDFELNAEFDGNNENIDAQMTDLSSNDQELEGVNEIDVEKLKNVVSLLQSTVDGSLESSLDSMDLKLNEEFVVRVVQSPLIPGDHLIRFFKWGFSRNDFVVSTLVLSEFARVICEVVKPTRKNVYALWDLVKEIEAKESGVVNVEILNRLISVFSKLGKGKAAFEVFGKFEEFDCVPNADSYYLTIEALCRRSFYYWAKIVSQKMLNAGMLSEREKVGDIICYYCKGHELNEAYVIYRAAKEKKMYPPQKAVSFLISCLSKSDETLSLAQEVLGDIPDEVRKHEINVFTWVIRGLCREKRIDDCTRAEPYTILCKYSTLPAEIESAKKLLAEMMVKGPPPGNAVFNLIINSLSKAGDLEDAKEMLNLMESRGLKPDVFTYNVIISGYVKGGMMEDACKILSMAKKKHPKLCPATFHTLIRGYCTLGQFDKAVKLLSQMKKHGVEPNVDEYNKLIQSLCLKRLDWETSEKLLEEMKAKGLYLPGITRGLISAVKELEQEVIVSEEAPAKA